MRYAIITNPSSGKMSKDKKLSLLAGPAKILGSEIYGLDATTTGDLCQCARQAASHCDVLIAAGGDGTLSDIINSVDISGKIIAYLPLGTGNSMAYALKYKGDLIDIANRIRNGNIHECDLIDCDGKRQAFMASVGIEGDITRLRGKYLGSGTSGFLAYLMAFSRSYFIKYRPTNATLYLNNKKIRIKNLLSFIVAKHPYYGFGMKVVPRAELDDSRLHIMCVKSNLIGTSLGLLTSFTVGNRAGLYYTGQKLRVCSEMSLSLQTDGNYAWVSNDFTFRVLPGAVRIKH